MISERCALRRDQLVITIHSRILSHKARIAEQENPSRHNIWVINPTNEETLAVMIFGL